jgi:hypothetical protein
VHLAEGLADATANPPKKYHSRLRSAGETRGGRLKSRRTLPRGNTTPKQTVTQICCKPARTAFSVRPGAEKSPAK